jgi:hypothetical protein
MWITSEQIMAFCAEIQTPPPMYLKSNRYFQRTGARRE